MKNRRLLIGAGVLVSAFLALSVFNTLYRVHLVSFLFDVAILSISIFLIGKIPPAKNIKREIGRLVLGAIFFLILSIPSSIAFEFLYEPLINSYNEGWLLLLRIPIAFSIAWSIWPIIRIGGPELLKRRRRIVISIILTLFVAYFSMPGFTVLIVGLYVALAAFPSKWIEQIRGKWGWIFTGIIVFAPLAVIIFLTDVGNNPNSILGTNIAFGTVEDSFLKLQSPLYAVLKSFLGIFWVILPLRLIVAIFQGTFGLRIPIWLKLATNYVFSTFIPTGLLLLLLLISFYIGIGSMRSRMVRDMVTVDLNELQAEIEFNDEISFADSDSIAIGTYVRVSPDTRLIISKVEIPAPPPLSDRTPDSPYGEYSSISLTTTPQTNRSMAQLDTALYEEESEEEREEIWVRLNSKPSQWAMPDTLPLFHGWSDEAEAINGILPIGNGRTAFAAAVLEKPGAVLATVALKPLNKQALEKYKDIVGCNIEISPQSEFVSGFRDLNSNVSKTTSPSSMWYGIESLKTEYEAVLDDSTWHRSFWKRQMLHGMCELRMWISETGGSRMSGMIKVRTSLSELTTSLYASQGLNKITLVIIGTLAAIFCFAVLFSNILGIGINRTITTSLSALRHGTEQLRRGNLDVVIDVRNRDELGDLAASFNHMTKDLRRMIKEVGEKERLERDIQIARQIQLQLLPSTLPSRPELSIAARSDPALEVGGDYYDAIDLGDDGILVALGDVSGKGVGAAFLMSNLQANLHVLSEQKMELHEMVGQLNRQICNNSTPEMFITCFLALIDPDNMNMTYINAGHDTPALLRGDEIIDLTEGGMLLGILEEAEYDTTVIQLEPGDIICCFSDGLTEAMDEEDEEFGRNRLLKSIQDNDDENPWETVYGTLNTVIDYAGKERAGQDDLTLMVIKINDRKLIDNETEKLIKGIELQ
jgi:serine phosphatase RsbU (regulator of sigma subunit)